MSLWCKWIKGILHQFTVWIFSAKTDDVCRRLVNNFTHFSTMSFFSSFVFMNVSIRLCGVKRKGHLLSDDVCRRLVRNFTHFYYKMSSNYSCLFVFINVFIRFCGVKRKGNLYHFTVWTFSAKQKCEGDQSKMSHIFSLMHSYAFKWKYKYIGYGHFRENFKEFEANKHSFHTWENYKNLNPTNFLFHTWEY